MKRWQVLLAILGAILMFGCTMIDVRGITWIPWCETLIEKQVGEHKFLMERGKWTNQYKEFCINGEY